MVGEAAGILCQERSAALLFLPCVTQNMSGPTLTQDVFPMGEAIQRLVRLICLSQVRLADEIGAGHDTVRGWSSGRAEPSPENRAALAAFMRRHAQALVQAAEELERV